MSGDGAVRARGSERSPRDPATPSTRGPVLTSTYHLRPAGGRRRRLRTTPARAADLAGVRGGRRHEAGRRPDLTVFPVRHGGDRGSCAFGTPGAAMLPFPTDGYVAQALATRNCGRWASGRPTARRRGDWGWPSCGTDPALVLLETPSARWRWCDIAAVVTAAHKGGRGRRVDNTTAFPLGQRPLELGADLVVCLGPEALGSHGDLLLRHVSAADPLHAEADRGFRAPAAGSDRGADGDLARCGAGTPRPAPGEAGRQRPRARAGAGRPAACTTSAGGLPDGPAHALAARQMRRWNGVLRPGSPCRRARRLQGSCPPALVPDSATSFGGLHGRRPAGAVGRDAVPDELVRLSCGIGIRRPGRRRARGGRAAV
ncbi:cystathionine gamma-lyase [Pseudonocardia sp. MCCB 268]|nr:cystathionine gamma-lyase [Pseudonocardia cytotoxica]